MHTIPNMVSVIIPSRNEQFLQKTIQGLLNTAKGEIEIIVNLDGYWPPAEEIVIDPRVIYIHRAEAVGMREGINSCALVARGEYLMKSDAHCMYADGWDEILKQDVPYYTEHTEDKDDNWIVIPRRKRLDPEAWAIQDVGKVDIDYEYLSSPAEAGVKGTKWDERSRERYDDPQYVIDETMSFQGSCWFTTKNHYVNRLGLMSEEGYGSFVREAQEIGNKTWLSGGRVYTNKKLWYAHLHKGKTYGRGYYLDKYKMDSGNQYCDDFWFNNRWTEARHDMAWLIERFAPVPGWSPEHIEMVRQGSGQTVIVSPE